MADFWMADKQKYVFKKQGATRGSVTGQYVRFSEGDELVLPSGELRHMPSRFYETRPLEAKSTPEVGEIEHVGSGWYEVRVGGETKDKVRGEEDAKDRLNELT